MKRFHIIVVTLAIVRSASAEPDGAQAEILFRQGKELVGRGQYAEACAAFEASHKLDPTPSTLLNLADCREKNGQIATAWGLFLSAERDTRPSVDALGKQLHKTAADHAARLEPRLSTLQIVVTDEMKIGGLEVVRDGDVLVPAMWNQALPIDGGTYRITARAPGNADWTTTVTVANERDTKTVEIPRLKAADLRPSDPERPPASSALVTADPVVVTETPPIPTLPPRRRAWLPYAVAGGAVALVGGGVAFELASGSTYDRAKTEPDADRQRSLWHIANTERYAAAGLAVAGVTAGGIAVWLFISDRRAAESSVALAPVIGADVVGLQVMGGL